MTKPEKAPAGSHDEERILTSESSIQEVWREVASGRNMTLENIHSTLMESVPGEMSLGELLVQKRRER